MRVLVVNAGSSSLKLRLLDAGDGIVAHRDLGAPDAPDVDVETAAWLRGLGGAGPIDAVGHRIVHGGDRFRAAVRVDGAVRAALGELSDLAPLHQPKSLLALDAVTAALPDVPAVACFDTAFHATMPAAASTYAVPVDWRTRWGVRRYGFHGLSHAYAARRAVALAGDGARRLVSCHLGAGASATAILDGRSVDTSMGFTPLDGLVMATRSGSVDPGLLLWLLERERLTEPEMAAALERRAGLLSLAGTADMREVVERAEHADGDARLALDVYLHRLRATIGAMAAALGGLDALLFTGGVGERSAAVRAGACAGLRHLGVELDERRNAARERDADVAAPTSLVRVLVIDAREDLEVARQTRELLAETPSPSAPRRSGA